MVLFWLIMIVIAVLEVPRMLANRQYRMLIVFAGLWIISGTYASLVIMRVPLLSPIDILLEAAELAGLR